MPNSDTLSYKLLHLNVILNNNAYELSGKIGVYKNNELITVYRLKTPQDLYELDVLIDELGDTLRILECF